MPTWFSTPEWSATAVHSSAWTLANSGQTAGQTVAGAGQSHCHGLRCHRRDAALRRGDAVTERSRSVGGWSWVTSPFWGRCVYFSFWFLKEIHGNPSKPRKVDIPYRGICSFSGVNQGPPALTHSQVKLCSGEVGKNWEEQM